ncbi:hypothetical protein B0A55_00600 [Friedmanniomyces simplex]|uniref:Uncharacterized protein n=1 Tax=Friedmanniomyces simplex TaxID=329884 RepID=A0A4U0XZ67_9PEZI|nr:hypothetical protein B0A55_00600 [Friedmanniomyces simplex]
MGMVTTDNAQPTSIAQLLGSIERKANDGAPGPDNRPASLVLLLTPTYAQRALSGALSHLVLEALRIKGRDALTKPLDVITAVVDRLPSNDNRTLGEEGIAYMFMRNTSSLQIASQTVYNKNAQKPGSITFELPALPQRPSQYGIQLPLAQTVFSTGKASTLVHTRYKYDPAQGLVLIKQQHLEAQTVDLPFRADYGAVSLQFPVVPLTPLRAVRSSMGSIVRTLSSATVREETQTQTSEPQPASQELEAAVTSYFKALEMSPEAVNVWALIMPTTRPTKKHRGGYNVRYLWMLKSDHISQSWTSEGPPLLDRLNDAILRQLRGGARLHRVLSGGGGWGKKAGLLSLDPDSMYSSRELRADEGWEFDFDDEGADAVEKQQRRALGEIVREGEGIMFFLAPRDLERFKESRAKAWSYVERADSAAVFGTVPSTIDSVPEESASDARVTGSGADIRPRVQHRANLFGALSENGLALKFTPDVKLRPELELRRPGYVQTKLDVPFGNIHITEDAAEAENARSLAEQRAQAGASRMRANTDDRQQVVAVVSTVPKTEKDDGVRAVTSVRSVGTTKPSETRWGPQEPAIKLYRGQDRSYSTYGQAGVPDTSKAVADDDKAETAVE